MSHAHGIQISEQPWLKVSLDIHKRQHLPAISLANIGSTILQIFPSIAAGAAFGELRREQAANIAFQKEDLYSQLRSQRVIAVRKKIRKLAPPVRPLLTIEKSRQYRRKMASPRTDLFETLEPFPGRVAAKKFVPTLARESDLKTLLRCDLGNPIRVK